MPFAVTTLAWILNAIGVSQSGLASTLLVKVAGLLLPFSIIKSFDDVPSIRMLGMGALGFWVTLIMCASAAVRPWPKTQALIKKEPRYLKIGLIGIVVSLLYIFILKTYNPASIYESGSHSLKFIFILYSVFLPTVSGLLLGIFALYTIVYFKPARAAASKRDLIDG